MPVRCVGLHSAEQEAYRNWLGKNAAPLEFDSNPSETAFPAFFSRHNCRLEVVGDAISGVVVVDQVGVDIRVKFGDSRLNRGPIIRLVTGWIC